MSHRLKHISAIINKPITSVPFKDHEFLKMERNIQTKFLNIEHKAKLLSQNLNEEPRKVKCYISPRVRLFSLFLLLKLVHNLMQGLALH